MQILDRTARDGSSISLQKSGKSHPLGATAFPEGTNFSIFSKHSTAVQLLLFDHVNDPEPARVIELERDRNRTYHYWHTFLPGIAAGQIYAYRVAGPFDPAKGLRFDPQKVLLDPYGKCIARPSHYSREDARRPGSNTATALRSVVADPCAYDWEGDVPPARPFAKTIIYEIHVGGFTRHPNSGVAPSKRGTYAGLIDKIPYLQDLGISTIELLPIFAFDEQDAPPVTAITGVISRSRFSHRILRTVPEETRWVRSTNFVTWSRRYTALV